MGRRLGLLATVASVVATGACGGGGGSTLEDAPGGDGPTGPGTGTLEVTGSCVARNTGNSDQPDGVRVDCQVRVLTGSGAPVATAQVRINPAPPAIQVQLLHSDTDPSLYSGFYIPYAFSARISVQVAGEEDFVGETVLSGPGMHRIERPNLGMSVTAGQPVTVSWERPDPVAETDVVLDSGFEALGLADPGTFDIPDSAILPGMDRVRVTRWRRNPLGVGAASGSSVDFGVETGQMFTIVE